VAFFFRRVRKNQSKPRISIYAKTIPRKGPLSTFLQHSGLPLFVPQAYNKDSRETLLTQIAQEFAPEVEEGLQWAEMQIQKQALLKICHFL
jgi:hypothetical protein